MKQFYYIIILAICFTACKGKSDRVEIKGELKGLSSDTIYVYGNDELSNLRDTIYVRNGKISHTIPLDTLLQVTLILDNEREYPLYLDKGKKVIIKSDLTQSDFLDVKGVALNEQLTAFNRAIYTEGINANDTAVISRAEEFIRTNHTSLVSIYLLDKYFVQKDNPDLDKIKDLIANMYGTLQDKPYIERLNGLLEQAEKAEPGKLALSFSLPNAKGENISRSKFRNKYLLINFWASWSDSCKTANTELRNVYKKYKDHDKFAILGISLDMDKDSWRNTIKADTLQWEQVCDFMGLDNVVAKQYGVYTIPYNILLGTDGKVLERNISGQALTDKLEELLSKPKN